MHCTDKNLQNSSIIWLAWPNVWVFVYKLRCCGFESCCSHLNFRYCTCFDQKFHWHPGKYRMWIDLEMRTWDSKNIQSRALYRKVLTVHLNHLLSLAKWLSVRLRTERLWLRVKLQSLKLDIAPVSSKEFLHIQANTEYGFTLKCVCDMTRTYSERHRTDKWL